jgi:ABC-2 type transport system ATP-binding protein
VEINARALRVDYGAFTALDLPTLTVAGRVIAVIGHNGAGKSTFIKALLNLIPPASGVIGVEAFVATQRQRLIPERDMAFCPEMGSVFADITVESYIRLWCRLKQGDGTFYRHTGSRYIELLSISPLLRKLGRELSKGQRRRVQTAIGFLTEPRFFLFDEPFDGLDVQRTNELSTLIAAESETRSFLISSHRMDVVQRLADVVVVLKEGTCLAAGRVEAVCAELSGRTAIITAGEAAPHVSDLVSTRFPTALLSRRGGQITVTGPMVDPAALTAALAPLGDTPILIDIVAPRLVDAMNYHLLSLRGRPTETSGRAAATAAE